MSFFFKLYFGVSFGCVDYFLVYVITWFHLLPLCWFCILCILCILEWFVLLLLLQLSTLRATVFFSSHALSQLLDWLPHTTSRKRNSILRSGREGHLFFVFAGMCCGYLQYFCINSSSQVSAIFVSADHQYPLLSCFINEEAKERFIQHYFTMIPQ